MTWVEKLMAFGLLRLNCGRNFRFVCRKTRKFMCLAASGEKKSAATFSSTTSNRIQLLHFKRRPTSQTNRSLRALRSPQSTRPLGKFLRCWGTRCGFSLWQQVNGHWFTKTRLIPARFRSASCWTPPINAISSSKATASSVWNWPNRLAKTSSVTANIS